MRFGGGGGGTYHKVPPPKPVLQASENGIDCGVRDLNVQTEVPGGLLPSWRLMLAKTSLTWRCRLRTNAVPCLDFTERTDQLLVTRACLCVTQSAEMPPRLMAAPS